jgi:hypothetical protein
MKKITPRFIQCRVEAYSKKVARLLGVKPKKIKVIIRKGMVSTAAHCYESEHTGEIIIAFSKEELKRSGSQILFDCLIGHEVVHAYDLNSDDHHGKKWFALMTELGLPPILVFDTTKLKKYLIWYDDDWAAYSDRKLQSPYCTLVRFDKRKIKKDWQSCLH